MTDGVALAAVLIREPPPLSLIDSTVKATLGFATKQAATAGAVSTAAAALARGVLHAMMMSKIKILGAAALAGMLALGGAQTLARQYGGTAGKGPPQKALPAKVDRADALLRSVDQIDQVLDEMDRRNHDLRRELGTLRNQIDALRAGRPEGLDKVASDAPSQTGEGASRASMTSAGVASLTASQSQPRDGDSLASVTRETTAGLSIGGGPARAGNTKSSLDSLRGPLNTAADKGTPAGAIDSGPPHIDLGQYVFVKSAKGDRVAVFDRRTGESKLLELPVPEGSRHAVTPIMGSGILALDIRGAKISRIAVYTIFEAGDQRRGSWYPQKLREPVDQARAMVTTECAAYVLGRFVYAFSAHANRWDVLELPVGSHPQVSGVSGGDEFKVEYGSHLYTFNVLSGQWDDIDFNAILGYTPTAPAENVRKSGTR